MDAQEALVSETRREILAKLSERNRRPSDLSRELGKDISPGRRRKQEQKLWQELLRPRFQEAAKFICMLVWRCSLFS